MPTIDGNGNAVNWKTAVEPGTGPQVGVSYVIAAISVLIGGAVSYGILWVVLLFAPVVDWFNRKKQMALLRGSAIEVGPQQFPEIHQCATAQAQRLGMEAPPTIFIVEGNLINAAAMRIGGRKVIMLIDDVVDACLRSGDPQTLAFILGHEMAHHAMGHTGLLRMALAKYNKKLARLDEFSCDAVANELVENPKVSAKALTILLTGPQLLKFVNLNQLLVQAEEVANDKNSVKAERQLTHPLILRRIQRFQKR